MVVSTAGSSEPIVFRDALDDTPLDLKLRTGDELTDGLKEFYVTGVNPYRDQPEAVVRGGELYTEFCVMCHMADGNGRFGPSLIDDVHINPRAGTDVGNFEIVMGGAFGAMRPFSDRMSQDEMLKVLAYVDGLATQAAAR
ncbi:MAG: c-type cytochrome [Gammaproteobacteria bacterium]|nr:c-type cytochrome [Gammaproteobacteria bacterium]